MKIDKTNVKVPLTKEELDILISKEMPNERLECIRDVFCFCALTGLAFTDADNLQKRHITTDDSGTTWIHKPREKTSVISRVPLLPYPLKILQNMNIILNYNSKESYYLSPATKNELVSQGNRNNMQHP